MSLVNTDTISKQTWHTLTADEALATLQTTPGGLTTNEASNRLGQYGPNTIQTGVESGSGQLSSTSSPVR